MTRICFVCHGNICRSPTAEAVMRALVDDAGLGDAIVLDSAGVSDEHAGEPPDRRAIAAALRRGLRLEHRARRFTAADFDRFDHVIAMDRDNLRRLQALAPTAAARAKLELLRPIGPSGEHDVPDPWYEGGTAFDRVLDICELDCAALLARLHPPAR